MTRDELEEFLTYLRKRYTMCETIEQSDSRDDDFLSPTTDTVEEMAAGYLATLKEKR